MNRWDPLRNLLSVQERVNRLFEDALGGEGTVELASAGMWSPAIDICETDREFLVLAEVPEVKEQDIDIRVKGNTLIIEGERKVQRALMEACHRIERSYGRFQRSFLLSGVVEPDRITATLRDGILKIILPKKVERLRETST